MTVYNSEPGAPLTLKYTIAATYVHNKIKLLSLLRPTRILHKTSHVLSWERQLEHVQVYYKPEQIDKETAELELGALQHLYTLPPSLVLLKFLA